MVTAVCLVSGGMDSLVALATARQETSDTALLHANYGHLTESRELKAFADIADYYGSSKRLIVDIGYLREIGGSALTDPSIVLPPGQVHRSEIPVSYVPFRNAHLLAIATSWAEVLGARHIYIGAVEEDSSGYPDCRESFFRAFNRVIGEGTRPETRIEIVAPLLHLSKKQIVETGTRLKVPFELTWSCYCASDLACGSCDSCLLRLKGFSEAGITDPIPYAR
ncbi:MAG: 7-cyano-7-deazaguanine synthase QueC [Acidobacteriota bacterium]